MPATLARQSGIPAFRCVRFATPDAALDVIQSPSGDQYNGKTIRCLCCNAGGALSASKLRYGHPDSSVSRSVSERRLSGGRGWAAHLYVSLSNVQPVQLDGGAADSGEAGA